MKLRKTILKGLVLGLLFNNIGYSFANVKSLDERYETFEGNNISIDNVLEEDKIDVEIEGNTLVNLFGNQGGETVNINNSNSSRVKEYNNIYLKPNRKYTLSVNIDNLSSDITSKLKVYYTVKNSSNDIAWYYPDGHYSKENVREGRMIITFNTDDRGSEGLFSIYVDVKDSATGTSNEFSFDINECILLEGELSKEEIPEYFEGMKSVGEYDINMHRFEVLSNNSLVQVKKFKEKCYLAPSHQDILALKVVGKPNTQYTMSTNHIKNSTYYDFFFDTTSIADSLKNGVQEGEPRTITSNSDGSMYVMLRDVVYNDFLNGTYYIYLQKTSSYSKYQSNKKEILLNEPLRGLPNGVKDRVIRRNGQWVIERNTKKITIDDSFNFNIYNKDIYDPNELTAIASYSKSEKKLYSNAISNVLPTVDLWTTNKKPQTAFYNYTDGNRPQNDLYFIIPFSSSGVLESDSDIVKVQKCKQWLIDNNATVIAERANPIYEPLNIDLYLNMYLDTTYISNNSSIPVNMKVIVDRTVNRAVEAIELAQENPTIYNISIARMWINLMKESSNKDIFSNQLGNITEIQDLTIEKKTATANVDIYIKAQNGLSMTLSTNSIIFDEFDSTEDMEKLNAVDVTIDSSLPYSLNSYLVNEIKNENGNNIISKELFNIKINGENDYKAFVNINEKLVLKEDCPKGENRYGIDLILKGSLTHEADVYKTTIKFEAEQK